MAKSAALANTSDVALIVKLKGRATASAISEAAGFDASAALAALVDDGLIEPVKAFFKVTSVGLASVTESIAAARASIGESLVSEWYALFCPINDDFKAMVTDWQLRPTDGAPVINDHTDRGYDGAVLGRLRAIDDAVGGLLARFPLTLPRYGRYRERLGTARARLVGGRREFMASPAVDSYHSIWFELHEDLILLGGRTRAGEAEAGRG